MIKTRKRTYICLLLILANLAFIWGNSLTVGEVSEELSGGILARINSILGLDESTAVVLHMLIRKAAHFTEFAFLGTFLSWSCGMTGVQRPYLYALPLLGGMSAACVDETIQIFVGGRSSSLLDVWLDVSGVLAGMIFLLFGHHLLKKRNQLILEETK